MKIKLNKDVKWLEPYLKAADSFVPIRRISSVIGYQVPFYKTERQYGSITVHYDKNQININLLIKTQDLNQGIHKNARMANVLDSLAHELAHLLEWEHTPEHLMLQAKLLMCFAKVSKELKVKDLSLRLKNV